MKKIVGIICVVFVAIMITSPFLVSVEASFAPAQATSPTFSGELLPDPYFAEEPSVVIGYESPEFDYVYTPGSISLIWAHTAGYELTYAYYPYNFEEYALVSQQLPADYNGSIQAVKIAATIAVDCTGDFTTLENMWDVNIGISHIFGGAFPLRTITDLNDGDAEEIEFMLSETETNGYFYNDILPADIGLFVQLIPSAMFAQTIGNTTPWMDYSGSVVLTITHLSFEVMIEGDSSAPILRSPNYNTTLLNNETPPYSYIVGIESAGYDQLYQFRQNQVASFDSTFTLHTLTSDHDELRSSLVYSADDSQVTSIFNFAADGDRIVVLSVVVNDTDSRWTVEVQNADSFGNFLWNTTVNQYFQDIPLQVTFDGAGNVYVYMLSLHAQEYPYEPENSWIVHSIVKLDNLGNQLWNQTVLSQSYVEYVSAIGTGRIYTGFGRNGNNILVGVGDIIYKFDTNGNEVWTREYVHQLLCMDPRGGFYTYIQRHGIITEITRWGTNGNADWTKSLSFDYGNGWKEYPVLRAITVGPNGPVHLILEYNGVQSRMVLTRVTRAGALISSDTILENRTDEYGRTYLPFISDIAVTGDGRVHICGLDEYYPYGISPFGMLPGEFLLTYELPSVLPFNPLTLTMMGVASVLIVGIAYDFFFRRGKVPEPPVEPSVSDFEW